MTEKSILRPSWLTKRIAAGGSTLMVHQLLRELDLNTVCEGAHCPNIGECFHSGTATFLILGAVCTRKCTFCAMPKGVPAPVDSSEPEKLAKAVELLKIKHVVITSVTRDDLPDGGARHFANCAQAIGKNTPEVTIELLVPDFNGDTASLNAVLNAKPTVLNHNIETVPRLYAAVRPGADYERSLKLLSEAARAGFLVKSGFMVGLGETATEVKEILSDLYAAGVNIVTIGQYLQPSPLHLPIVSYITPEQFKLYEKYGFTAGIKKVIAGPFVRSSYHASSSLDELVHARLVSN